MKRIIALGLTALVLATTGCVQLESNVVIEKDGSGTLNVTYTIPLDVESALREMASLDSGMDEDMGMPPLFDESFDMSAMKSDLEPHGVKMKDYSNTVEGEARVVRLSLAFTDVDGMQAALENAGGGDAAMGLRRTSDGNYYIGEVPSAHAFDEEDEEEAVEYDPSDMEDMGAAMKNAARSMELMGVLMSRASEMKVQWTITVPGDVISNNADSVDGRTCTWVLDSSTMMSGSMASPEIVFSGAGLKIEAPEK